ncbi:hypothetical protein COU17_00590 [Candidatus Kaiserbacteria bacterium CG10_big_fil_rev_8_21_14_0_10_49_17]|uniref:TGS domain-containing protein n=1 Tax=Candidatus Kaiserbacteria bacterium CG10_big_fil_rev_8_21_14_0_10_49_17 TaxID=1974609 RepID=A0A2M6WFB5_9BACT|nr:MAG: hypothetical protein COU17_00590 [Candidatus Kaiserbacteria bacterium CG10_big_fil_rev_8_21_14_0_10_49_17]
MASVKDITKLMDSPSKEDVDFVNRAYAFAKKAHEGHKRYSGEPYFTHLYDTAKGLAEIGMGPKTIAAGFLHDSIEDVGVKPEDIAGQFGEEVLFLVEGVTKLGTLKYRGVQRHTESLRKLFVATSQDVRVVLIKLLDRRHNMSTLQYVPKNKQLRIAQETLEVYAPIADRLSMGRLKRELEDYAFPFAYPKEYGRVKALVQERTKHGVKSIEKVNKQLKKELAKEGVTRFRTEQRIKGLYSLYKKLERKDWDIDKIHDVMALRIIVPSVSDCYHVLGTVHTIWRPLPGKIKDYIAFPKPNGYQSIHTTVFTGTSGTVEIQIRTEQMHREAQFGIASHVGYKGVQRGEKPESTFEWIMQFLPSVLSKPTEKKQSARKSRKKKVTHAPSESVPSWIKQIADEHQSAYEEEEFLLNIKSDFFSHRVFVFTPEGDVIDLPIDSSPVDFAYAIHSDIGNHIAGAKVNGKLASLDTKLKNGDIVEILTKESAKPSQKWFEVAKTTLAKRHIKAALEAEN